MLISKINRLVRGKYMTEISHIEANNFFGHWFEPVVPSLGGAREHEVPITLSVNQFTVFIEKLPE